MYPAPPLPFFGKGGYKVCVALTASHAAELMQQAEAALAKHPFLELRLDSLADPFQSLPVLADVLPALLQRHPQAQLIATCRRQVAGGHSTGTAEEEVAVLSAAAYAGCSLVDLAIETADELGLERTGRFREQVHGRGASLLLSYHNFEETRSLEQAVARLMRHHPDILKIVTTANSLIDNLTVLRLLRAGHPVPLVSMAMSEAGLPSRVLGPSAGSLFTFASAAAGAETAPGQPTAATLRNLYRVEEVTASTRVYAVAGKPISQSLSPAMHNAAFAAAGIDAVFLPLLTDDPLDLLAFVRGLPIEGLSITMPLKQSVLPLLDWVHPLAERVGACNTIVRTATGELHGYNTDVAGVIAPIEKRIALRGARVLVQGAGGAARAAVFGLSEQGAEVWVHNRSANAAEALAAEAGARVADVSMLLGAGKQRGSKGEAFFDVLVNATPSGMGSPGQRSSEAAGQEEDVPLCAKLIFDMVYSPPTTPLIQRARAQGLPVITGVEMFIQQGAGQFELWTGRPAPETEMQRVVLEALRARENGAESTPATRK